MTTEPEERSVMDSYVDGTEALLGKVARMAFKWTAIGVASVVGLGVLIVGGFIFNDWYSTHRVEWQTGVFTTLAVVALYMLGRISDQLKTISDKLDQLSRNR